jgi:hypothetical protein
MFLTDTECHADELFEALERMVRNFVQDGDMAKVEYADIVAARALIDKIEGKA